jgi:hypothetical protein
MRTDFVMIAAICCINAGIRVSSSVICCTALLHHGI